MRQELPGINIVKVTPFLGTNKSTKRKVYEMQGIERIMSKKQMGRYLTACGGDFAWMNIDSRAMLYGFVVIMPISEIIAFVFHAYERSLKDDTSYPDKMLRLPVAGVQAIMGKFLLYARVINIKVRDT